MCTAISYKSYSGRNLDVDKDYGEEVIIAPRNYGFKFKEQARIDTHYAMIGMGIVADGYPLYFDAANERGLYIAGLNYLCNAKYMPVASGKVNLAPYELIPYILSRCSSVSDAKYELRRINLVGIPFRRDMALAELHFFIADKRSAIAVEPDADGMHVYENPVGILTNNPSFPIQLFNLNNYMGLTNDAPENRFAPALNLTRYSFGMGAIGLPGDLSSCSRFVRAAFHKLNSNGRGSLADIMHLLSSVAMPEGSVRLGSGFERTEYSSAIDLERLIYSYRMYENPNTYAIKMHEENLDSKDLLLFKIKKEQEPIYCNGPCRS